MIWAAAIIALAGLAILGWHMQRPRPRSMELMTPESCNRMTQASVRTTPLSQKGTSTQRMSASRTFLPTMVMA